MDIEQVKVLIESLSGHYEKHREKHSYSKQAQAILARRSSSLTISSSAAKISAIYEAVRKSGNTDAIQAFRDTMVKFSQEGTTEDFIHFVHTAEDLAQSSPNTLISIFSTVSDIEEVSLKQNLSLDAVAWLSNLGYLTNSEIESYIGATEQVLQFEPDDIGGAFKQFVSTTSGLVKTDKPDQERIDRYFEGVQNQKSGSSFHKFEREYRESEE